MVGSIHLPAWAATRWSSTRWRGHQFDTVLVSAHITTAGSTLSQNREVERKAKWGFVHVGLDHGRDEQEIGRWGGGGLE